MKVHDFYNKYNYLFELKCKPSYGFDKDTKEKIYFDNSVHILIKDRASIQPSATSDECKKDKECQTLQNKLNENINIFNNFYFYDKDAMQKDKEYINKCKNDPVCKDKLTYQNELQFFNELLDTNVFNIDIRIGQETFHIYNVNSTVFKNDLTFIALIVKENNVYFHLNSNVYHFVRQPSKSVSQEIEIDNKPFIINENGGCNITLFSFAYFDTAICDYDLSAFKLYNYYYLYGANEIDEDKRILTNFNKELIDKLKSQ